MVITRLLLAFQILTNAILRTKVLQKSQKSARRGCSGGVYLESKHRCDDEMYAENTLRIDAAFCDALIRQPRSPFGVVIGCSKVHIKASKVPFV